MPKSKIKVIRYLIAAVILWGGFRSPEALAQQAKRPFTVADEIGLTLFDAQGMVGAPEIHFSPDGKYVAMWTEHGRLDLNCVEDSLRFYRTQDLEGFLKDGGSEPPQPAWVVTLSAKHGRVIPEWRWLKDSSGVAILRFDFMHISQQVVLADFRKKTVEPLTPPGDAILSFDVRDRQHYVYVVADHSEWSKKEEARSQAGAFVGTGVNQWVLLFPDDPVVRNWADGTSIKRLWAVVDGKRFEVKHNGAPPVFRQESAYMSLSPDGRSLAVIAPVEEVPVSWETLYPPPAHLPAGFEEGLHAVHAGHGTAEQYARIDLKSGSVQPLTGAPHIASLGLWIGAGPSWSSDGQQVLLPDTFVKSQQNAPGRPCVAIADLRSGGSRCAIAPKYGYTENTDPVDNFHRPVDVIVEAHFASDNDRRVLVTFDSHDGRFGRTTEYQPSPDGAWQAVGETIGQHENGIGGVDVKVTRGVNDPPLLVAANKTTSRVLWDPNPQLKDIELAKATDYRWKDAKGREWGGGLYKPANYRPGQRYPLVIQTHGYTALEFRPSGVFSTAFAAQELAANGIMVLQTVNDDLIEAKQAEACNADLNDAACTGELIESAVKQLVADGLADPEKIGIIGFSHTCYYVMDMLTKNAIHFKAASITGGVMMDYWQYMLFAGDEGAERAIGARPFGEGLQEWVKRSPGFNLDKVNAPLLVNAQGQLDVAGMWLPYAGLRALKKPVELMVFNLHEHILTNPATRVASQGGSVDWFRFWLQGYEDPDPTKAEQYKRWRGLRQMQADNERKSNKNQALSN